MGYRGQTARIPFDAAGFQHSRNQDLLIPTALVEPTKNINFHEGGIGKRGGNTKLFGSPITNSPAIRGLFDFRKRNGSQYLMFATLEGKVYWNTETNVIKTGMSTSNFFNFSSFNDEVYVCDGASVPQYWDGVAANTSSVTVPTSWTTNANYPFQMIPHGKGASSRVWAFTKDSAWASAHNNGHDFSDANVIQIPIPAEGGLVGGIDFGGVLIVFSKTKAYLIDDSDIDPDNWGYQEAIWEGGVAHWRLIIKAGNNVFLVTDEGNIYSLRGVQATGDYESVNLTRPAFIDRWIREKVSRSNIENFHAAYDRTLRAINFFFQVGGTQNNTNLKFFIDRPPEVAWVPHDNLEASSGFLGSCSAEVRVSVGDYRIYTGDFSGMIWKHEQTGRDDNGSGYESSVKLKALDMGNPRIFKHFSQGRIRTRAAGNYDLTVRVWIDGVRKPDISLSLAGTGATFDTAMFDSSVFSEDSLIPVSFEINDYGFDLQLEILNSETGEDFFLSELLLDYKEEAIRRE